MKRILLMLLSLSIMSALLLGCGADNNGTEPANTTASSTLPNIDDLTLQEFKDMSSEQQMDIVESFETPDDYAQWLDKLTKEDESGVEQQKDTTAPTVNNETVASAETVETTENTESTQATEPSTIFPDDPDVTVPEKDEVTFLEYHAMSAAEQKEFINTFSSIDAFVEWHAAAKKAYDDSLIEIGMDGKPIVETKP